MNNCIQKLEASNSLKYSAIKIDKIKADKEDAGGVEVDHTKAVVRRW